jgi:exopolysaccharide biosynthesis WecB/TagA/CpsF family protein
MENLNSLKAKLTDKYLEKGLATFLNPYSYLQVRSKLDTLEQFDSVFVDGQLLVLYFKLLGVVNVQRTSFDMTSLAPPFFRRAEEKSKTICLVGSTGEEISSAVSEILLAYPKLNIVHYRNGYFAEDERDAELDLILNLAPDFVIVGLGAPLQEQFLVDLKQKGWVGGGLTCGGFFHQTATGINYYPKWIDSAHLRWAYRIWDEPKLFKRYFIDYPKALVFILWDFKIRPIIKIFKYN